MDINWKTATKADRTALYQVARAIVDTTDLSVEAIMEHAFGHTLVTGTDYLSNFRSGAIGRAKSKLIHAWIAAHHLETAHAFDPVLFPKPHTDVWDNYLDTHAIKSKLRIARFDKSMGLVQRKRSRPKPEEVIKLSEEFCFHLDSDIDGYAAAFEGYKGQWHSLPLGLDDDPITTIQAGEQFLPIDENGQPEKLNEEADLGHHQFVIAVSKEVTELPTPVQPPEPDSGVLVHVVRVQFVS